MFTVNSSILKDVVNQLVSSAKRAKLAKGHMFLSASDGQMKLYFVGDNIQAEKTISVSVQQAVDFSTTALELSLKTDALPNDVEITFKVSDKKAELSWGRESSLTLITTPETAPAIEIPEVVTEIKWNKGTFHYFARQFSGFCALENSEAATTFPVATGVHFSKDDTNQLIVEATNRVRCVRGVFNHEWFEEVFSIPAESLNAVSELISTEGEVTLGLNAKRSILVIQSGNTIALSRILSGTFPNIAGHFRDGEAAVVWRADRLEILETARRIKKLGGDKPVFSTKHSGSKALVVLDGILMEQIGAVIESEEKLDFSINAEGIEAALTVLRSEEILFAFDHNKMPITILSGDEGSAENIKVLLSPVVES